MINLILLVASIVLIIFVAVASKRHGRNQDAINARFLEAEREANSARRREIEPEHFFEPDFSALPEMGDADPHSVLRAAKRKMLRFAEPLSNLELKKKYGPANLESITAYEENFSDFLKSLGEWAKALRESGNQNGAMQVLAYAIGLGSELRGTYRLAADIFWERRDARSLGQLLAAARDNYFSDSAVQEHILDYIGAKLDEIGEAGTGRGDGL